MPLAFTRAVHQKLLRFGNNPVALLGTKTKMSLGSVRAEIEEDTDGSRGTVRAALIDCAGCPFRCALRNFGEVQGSFRLCENRLHDLLDTPAVRRKHALSFRFIVEVAILDRRLPKQWTELSYIAAEQRAHQVPTFRLCFAGAGGVFQNASSLGHSAVPLWGLKPSNIVNRVNSYYGKSITAEVL